MIGNIGKTPELKYTSTNKAVLNFTMATSEGWRDKVTGEWKEDVQWHKVTAWDRIAENAHKYARAGAHVYVEGKLKTNAWKKSETETVYQVYIEAQEVQVMDTKGPQAQPLKDDPPLPAAEDDDMPI
jgi:single-strand DNA-binding protein